jgi:predicted transcriptional regulator
MVASALKQRILDAVEQLPPDATIEDVIERLCFVAKVERGLAQADAGQLIPHEEIVKQFKR